MAKDSGLWLNLRLPRLCVATDFFAPGEYTYPITPMRGLGLTIYLDLVMGLNFLVDLLLLLGTNHLSGGVGSWKRLTLAAALGGIYGGLCLVPGFRFLGNLLWRVVFLGLMGVIAFGWNALAPKQCAVFLLLSMALGGLTQCLSEGKFLAVPASAAGLWAVCRIAFPGGEKQLLPLQIRWGGRSVSLLALKDTGNTLRDPVTGKSVQVISAEAARQLTGLQLFQLTNPVETVAEGTIPGLRLIPYRAVGVSGGLLLGMVFEDVVLGSQRGRSVVAFDPGGLGNGMQYQALTGGAL